jgi:DNA-binding NarL/FixJ family response regulator
MLSLATDQSVPRLPPGVRAPFPNDFDGRLEYPSGHGQRSVVVRCHSTGTGYTIHLPEFNDAAHYLADASVVLTVQSDATDGPSSMLTGHSEALADEQVDPASMAALEQWPAGIQGRYFFITPVHSQARAATQTATGSVVPTPSSIPTRASAAPQAQSTDTNTAAIPEPSTRRPDGAVITVFILDDHEIVRRGLMDLLDAHPQMQVVGEAASVSEALHRIPAVRPDVAVLDVRLPDGSGVEVCREIRSLVPNTRCLMLTSFDDDDALFAAVMAGASGYVLKEIRGSSLTEAVEQIAAGRSLIDPSLTDRLLQRLREPTSSPTQDEHDKLTPREHEILLLITEGLTNRQIGERLFLAEKTVKHYVSGLLTKLGMQRRTQIAAYGSRLRDSR